MKNWFGIITLLTGIGVLVFGSYWIVNGATSGRDFTICLALIVLGFIVAITGMKVLQS